ncbi:MAG TPA: hypothetical protein VM118_04220 [Acidobacteriota bacterium]|nr:hypothetical protein [Acidobacteriota bacterium]
MQPTAEQIRLAQQAARQNPAVARYIADRALKSQRSILSLPYYSRVVINTDVTSDAGPPVVNTYTIPQGLEVVAFGYAVNDDMGAGGAPGTIARYCDTNLSKRGETVSGQELDVHGISLQYGPTSDAVVAGMAANIMSVRVKVDGMDDLMLGPMGFAPGSGGLIGGNTNLLVPATNRSRSDFHPPSNGEQRIDNFLPFPYPLKWKPSGQPDSTLTVILRAERAAAITATARTVVEGTCDCTDWEPPEHAELDLWVRLHCSQKTPRSVNR